MEYKLHTFFVSLTLCLVMYGIIIHRLDINKSIIPLPMTLDKTADWKLQESRELSSILQNRLHYLQNPLNCSTARKVLCNMDREVGFGSMLHDILFCLHYAYATKRTLILDSSKWDYSPHKWEKVFQPLSETCTDPKGQNSKVWNEENIDMTQVVILPSASEVRSYPHPRPSFLPQAIPRDLAPQIARFHNFPFVWWQGQLLRYALRPGEKLNKFIDATRKRLHFQKPIVGVHIRRTDKRRESGYHQLEEYMVHVEKYFERKFPEQSKLYQTIYLATDEPSIIEELREKYPQYSVIHNQNFTELASSQRWSEESLYGIIADLHFLSQSDYLVCTWSSNVCRRAYELMQSLNIDASNQTKSLDRKYFFWVGYKANTEIGIVVEDHIPTMHGDLQFKVGDNIKLREDFHNGSCHGLNVRTYKKGIYPCHKVIMNVKVDDFPDYSEADTMLRKTNLHKR